jgi:hypothetical protein
MNPGVPLPSPRTETTRAHPDCWGGGLPTVKVVAPGAELHRDDSRHPEFYPPGGSGGGGPRSGLGLRQLALPGLPGQLLHGFSPRSMALKSWIGLQDPPSG